MDFVSQPLFITPSSVSIPVTEAEDPIYVFTVLFVMIKIKMFVLYLFVLYLFVLLFVCVIFVKMIVLCICLSNICQDGRFKF